jgi:rhodanese-related sulfurtransferase
MSSSVDVTSQTGSNSCLSQFLAQFAGSSLLLAGPTSSLVYDGLQGIGVQTVILESPLGAQLDQRFDVIALSDTVTEPIDEATMRALLHMFAQHLQPGGAVVSAIDLALGLTTIKAVDQLFASCDLHLEQRFGGWDRQPYEDGSLSISVHRRTHRYNVHDMVHAARSKITRLSPSQLADALQSSIPPLVVDIRTPTDRERFGAISGSVHIPRTLVEWHLDPANGYTHPQAQSFDQPLVVICNGGYSSSLSAAHLVQIGFTNVSDLRGGMSAWLAAGKPVIPPTHSHLDF